MAAAPGAPADAVDDYKKLRTLRELYKGRFTDDQAAALLRMNGEDLKATVSFVSEFEAKDLTDILREDEESWTLVTRKDKNRDILARARSGRIDTSAGQFACGPCDHFWWRRCPNRKLVSRCEKCTEKYDALPHDKEWGWAEFTCSNDNCENVFSGFCQMGTSSPCYRCGRSVYPTRIKPPSERPRRKTNREHRCYGRNCSGSRDGRGGRDGPECVHPSTRSALGLPRVVTPSELHDSSGSTVDSFLSQADLEKDHTDFFACVPSIPE